MSKTYIVSRNGGTVTKAPINDNKIPIYANETALDADLANIPDNTLVATEGGHDDVIDQMKEYIRKQNVLSEWKDITISTDSNNPTVMDFDGELILGRSGAWNNLININGFSIGTANPTSAGIYCPPISFSKGDRIYISPNFYSYFKARYYKDRDYTGR